MKQNKKIEFYIFLAAFVLIMVSVLAALNDKYEALNVFLDLITWAPLYGVGFIFSWIFRKRSPKVCDGAALIIALAVVAYFGWQWFLVKNWTQVTLGELIGFIIWLQLARSFSLTGRREFYLTYFLSFVLILYGAYTAVSIFFLFLFLIYFIGGALVLSLETLADFDLGKESHSEKNSLFIFSSLIFSLALAGIIGVAFLIYAVTPRWSIAPYSPDRLTLAQKSDPDFWKRIPDQELSRKLCNQTDLDRLVSRLVKEKPLAKNILEDPSRLKTKSAQPPAGPGKTSEKPPEKPPEKPKPDSIPPAASPPPKPKTTESGSKSGSGTEPSAAGLQKPAEPVKTPAPTPKKISRPKILKKNNSGWLILAAVFGAGAAVFYFLRKRRRQMLDYPNQVVIRLYWKIIKKLVRAGFQKKPFQTPREFYESLPAPAGPVEADPFFKLTGLFEIAFYSQQKIDYSQIVEATGLYQQIVRDYLKKLVKNKKDKK